MHPSSLHTPCDHRAPTAASPACRSQGGFATQPLGGQASSHVWLCRKHLSGLASRLSINHSPEQASRFCVSYSVTKFDHHPTDPSVTSFPGSAGPEEGGNIHFLSQEFTQQLRNLLGKETLTLLAVRVQTWLIEERHQKAG